MSHQRFDGQASSDLWAQFERAPAPPWEARLQDFQAGAIEPSNLVLMTADEPGSVRPGRETTAFWSLLVMVLEEDAEGVEPALSTVFGGLPADRTREGTVQLDGATQWSVLDGPEPHVKLSIKAWAPITLQADLVLAARPIAELLFLVCAGRPVALLPRRRLGRLASRGTLAAALAEVVLVPTRPSPALVSLIESHGWPSIER